MDGQEHTTDQATIWRWRKAFQHDFAARLDWTIKAPADANHNPVVIVNGRTGTTPIEIEATVGQSLVLDATGTTDPDGQSLRFAWSYYPEAGTGIPDLPVRELRRPPGGAVSGEGGIAPSPDDFPPRPRPRVRLEKATTPKALLVPVVPGISHVILEVEDNGSPTLTSYRRIIVRAR